MIVQFNLYIFSLIQWVSPSHDFHAKWPQKKVYMNCRVLEATSNYLVTQWASLLVLKNWKLCHKMWCWVRVSWRDNTTSVRNFFVDVELHFTWAELRVEHVDDERESEWEWGRDGDEEMRARDKGEQHNVYVWMWNPSVVSLELVCFCRSLSGQKPNIGTEHCRVETLLL